VKEDLEEHVAQFLLEFRLIVLLDRIQDLIGLFDQVRLERLAGLFAVPGAATAPRSLAMISTTRSNRSDMPLAPWAASLWQILSLCNSLVWNETDSNCQASIDSINRG